MYANIAKYTFLPCIVIAPLLLHNAGCGAERPARSAAKTMHDAAEQVPPKQSLKDQPDNMSSKTDGLPKPAVVRKVIYNASLRIVVEDYQATVNNLEEMLHKAGGYIAARKLLRRDGSHTTYTITLKIPAEGFRPAMQRIAALGYLESEHTNAEDISEQYYDTVARVRNAQKAEVQLLAIMEKKAGNLTEYLAVQRELNRVREEIERHQGRIRMWDNLVAFSTITVTLVERTQFTPPVEPTFVSRIAQGFSGSAAALFSFVKALILLLVVLIPWLVALAVVGLPLYWYVRRRKATAK